MVFVDTYLTLGSSFAGDLSLFFRGRGRSVGLLEVDLNLDQLSLYLT